MWAVLLLALGIGASASSPTPPFRQDRYAISFWVDPMVPPERFDAEYVRIKEANFTVLLGGFGAKTVPEVQLQIAAAARAGLAVVCVVIPRFSCDGRPAFDRCLKRSTQPCGLWILIVRLGARAGGTAEYGCTPIPTILSAGHRSPGHSL